MICFDIVGRVPSKCLSSFLQEQALLSWLLLTLLAFYSLCNAVLLDHIAPIRWHAEHIA